MRLFVYIVCLFTCVGCQKRETLSPVKKIFRANLYCEPPTLDPRKAIDSTSVNVLMALFEGLTRLDERNQPQPALAEKITVSEDGLCYTFSLRECYWSNLDKVTANDFVYAWKSILDPTFPAPYAYKLFMVKNARLVKQGILSPERMGVKAINENTLEVTLENPVPYFLELTAFPTLFPVNERIAKSYEEWSSEAGPAFVSNGPFKLASWKHESEINLEKNPFYWDCKEVKVDGIHFCMIDDVMTEYYMFENNELDWAGSPLSNLPLEIIPPLIKADKAISYPVAATYFYKINTEIFPLHNKYIRKALSYSVQRKEITEHITQAGQIPAYSLVPSMPYWEGCMCYFKDGDKEAALFNFERGLKELGMTKEEFPILTLTYNTNREHQKIAEAIQQQWQETLGIRVELENYDWKVYLNKIQQMDYQIARSGWIIDFVDPISFLEPFHSSDKISYGGGTNETGWEHPIYKNYLDQAEKTLDKEKRMLFLKEAEKLLIQEMPIIPIYHIVFTYLKKPFVKGISPNALGSIDLKKVQLDD